MRSRWCQNDEYDDERHGWCANRTPDEARCDCPCHAIRQEKRDRAELARLLRRYPEADGEQAAKPPMTGQKDHAALLARLTDEQLACALMSLHWRWLDAGGLSHGRSGEATLLEAYRDLLDLPRPPGNVNEWPSGQELVREAKNRVRDRLSQSPGHR